MFNVLIFHLWQVDYQLRLQLKKKKSESKHSSSSNIYLNKERKFTNSDRKKKGATNAERCWVY